MKTDLNTDVMAQIFQDYVIEKRRKRRWGIFFKFLTVAILVLFFVAFCSDGGSSTINRDEAHTALINLDGELMAGAPFNADRVVGALEAAYKDKGTKGIILRINSPGGSPVQADYIFNAITRLRKEHPSVPIYAVCTDICASGAYFVAAATQDIYANPSSLVGSIGVIMQGFGFVDAMKKVGVSRRVVIAGDNKDFMDPFAELTPKEQAYAQSMVDSVHQQFIAAVQQGRGKRLSNNPDIFSGMAWTGEEAKKLGLIDAYGSAGEVARTVIKADKIIDYTIKPSPFEQLANRMGASFANVFLSQLNTQLRT